MANLTSRIENLESKARANSPAIAFIIEEPGPDRLPATCTYDDQRWTRESGETVEQFHQRVLADLQLRPPTVPLFMDQNDWLL